MVTVMDLDTPVRQRVKPKIRVNVNLGLATISQMSQIDSIVTYISAKELPCILKNTDMTKEQFIDKVSKGTLINTDVLIKNIQKHFEDTFILHLTILDYKPYVSCLNDALAYLKIQSDKVSDQMCYSVSSWGAYYVIECAMVLDP